MPIYEYETVPSGKGSEPKRYEIRHCMNDEPLTVHPETGESIRKVYSSFAVCGNEKGGEHHHHHDHSDGHCCGGGGCGCHN